jgi:hypothetical protein
MAQRTGGGDMSWMAFLLGALAVGAAMFGWFVLSGEARDMLRSAEIRIERPSPLERPEIPDLPIDVPGGSAAEPRRVPDS